MEEAALIRINSWKNKFLSTAGREVLLKSVVMSLPIYSLSCYKLPKYICRQIEKGMARYWWCGNKDGKAIHWTAWQRLTKPKEDGGLEFKCLASVNDSLLAKQLWRILREPNLLISRVLKARYFPHQDLMSTVPKGSDSWV